MKDIRGRGLFVAIEFKEDSKFSAYDLCIKMKDNGLLTRDVHKTIIKFSPPLVINE